MCLGKQHASSYSGPKLSPAASMSSLISQSPAMFSSVCVTVESSFCNASPRAKCLRKRCHSSWLMTDWMNRLSVSDMTKFGFQNSTPPAVIAIVLTCVVGTNFVL